MIKASHCVDSTDYEACDQAMGNESSVSDCGENEEHAADNPEK
jgi:hypothetical protein